MRGSGIDHRKETVQRWAFLLLCLLVIFIGVGFTAEGWGAAHGGGVPGTFAVTEVHCGRDCTFVGNFTPDAPGSPVVHHVDAMGLHLHRVGDRVVAVEYDGEAYPPGGGGVWERGAMITSVGVVGLGLRTWRILRRRRRSRSTSAARASGRSRA